LFYLVENEISPDLRQKIGISDLVQSACLDIHQRLAERGTGSVSRFGIRPPVNCERHCRRATRVCSSVPTDSN
jgi:hypothetical protein